MTKLITFFSTLMFFCSYSSAELDYRPYAIDFIDGELINTFFETEEEMDTAFNEQRETLLGHMGASAFSGTDLDLSSLGLEEALNTVLENYEVGQVLFLTTLKEAPAVIEQRIEDSDTVALRDRPFRQFLQSSYCLVISPLAYFTDPLCRKARQRASDTIARLENNEVWFRYITNSTAVKIVENRHGQKGFAIYEFNFTLNPFASSDRPLFQFSDAMSVEETSNSLSRVYYFHAVLRGLFGRTYVPTSLFKVYEVEL